MLRVALQGKIKYAGNLVEIVRTYDNCIVSGICPGLNEPESEDNKLLDHPVQVFGALNNLIPLSDAVIFLDHQDETIPFVKNCLRQSRHVFINPTSLMNPQLLEEYFKLADEAGVILYLFHKPDLGILSQLIKPGMTSPEFIDIYRYVISENNSSENIKTTILDEMLYIQSVIPFAAKKIKVSTVPYCSDSPFIINLRIDFSNGTNANITINTFTGLESRFSEFYFSDRFIQVNTLDENIIQKYWKSDELSRFNHSSVIKNEKNPSLDILEFLKRISNISFPVNNSDCGYNIYNTCWELIKEINPVNSNKE